MITLKNTWLHFKKICIHKFWVAYYCFKCGLYWQGLMHDMSKFSWIEFWESVRYYQGSSSPINAAKKDQGYSLAWLHHKGCNPHHWEYWTDNYEGKIICTKIPYKYAVELICDWLGAARAYLGKDFSYRKELEWWKNRCKNNPPKMNKFTNEFITHVFTTLAFLEENNGNSSMILNKKKLEFLYNQYK